MKLIQQEAFGQCMVACCAMLAETTIEDVLNNVQLRQHNGVYYLAESEALIFLLQRGYNCVMHLRWEGNEIPDSFEFPIIKHNALVAVPSSRQGWDHAVVWDAKQRKILDPGECEPKLRFDYTFRDWIPVVKDDNL